MTAGLLEASHHSLQQAALSPAGGVAENTGPNTPKRPRSNPYATVPKAGEGEGALLLGWSWALTLVLSWGERGGGVSGEWRRWLW